MNEIQVTTQELCKFFGKTQPTICKKLKELGIEVKNGVGTVLNKEQVESLAMKLYRGEPSFVQNAIEQMFSQRPINSYRSEPISSYSLEDSPLSNKNVTVIDQLIWVVTQQCRAIREQNQTVAALLSERKESSVRAIAYVPPLTDRAKLNMIIDKRAVEKCNGHFDQAWNGFYEQYNKRHHMNLGTRAKHSNMKCLDYAEANGHIPGLLALAIELYGDCTLESNNTQE